MPSKVLVIGLDGGTYTLINKFHLPFLQSLQKKGTWGDLITIIPPVTAPAWVSFLTGKNPGKHGVFEFMQRLDNSYDLASVNSSSVQSHTFVDICSSRNKRVIMINIPVTYPPCELNGLCITGILTPGLESDYTYPRELKRDIEAKIGEYVIFSDIIYAPGQEEKYLAGLENQVEKRTELALYLFNNYQWDFFAVLYNATDIVQHGLWGYTDPRSHTYQFSTREKYAGGIERIYQKVDNCMKTLCDQAGPDTNLIVMSDHGAGPLYWFFHVNIYLLQKGYLKIKKNLRSQAKLALFKAGLTLKNVYQLAYRLGISRSRRALDAKRTRRKLLAALFLSFDDVDWDKTIAYSRGYIGQIFLNVKGREPRGIVEPGEEYHRLREQIIVDLKELEIPGKSGELISKIFRSEEIYNGPYVCDAPDITFLTTNMEAVAFGNFEFTSRHHIEKAFTGISGHHRMNGVYLFHGPDFRNLGHHRDINIIDLAPLILYLLGVPVDQEMDGKIPRDTIHPSFLREHTLQYQDYPELRQARHLFHRDEEEKIIEKLQGLGYM